MKICNPEETPGNYWNYVSDEQEIAIGLLCLGVLD